MKRHEEKPVRRKRARPELPDEVRAKLKDVPRRYHKMIIRSVTRRSRRFAIRVFCLECCGWSRSEVLRCSSKACALYPYRMMITGAKLDARMRKDAKKLAARAKVKKGDD